MPWACCRAADFAAEQATALGPDVADRERVVRAQRLVESEIPLRSSRGSRRLGEKA